MRPASTEAITSRQVSGTLVFMGFIHVQGLEEQLMITVMENRKRMGPFLHLADFVDRVSPGIEQLNILIRAGSFRFSGRTKKEFFGRRIFCIKKMLHPPFLRISFPGTAPSIFICPNWFSTRWMTPWMK